jgi:outer membrane protein W
MIRIFYRVLFVLFVLAGLRASAQSSDAAVWIVTSQHSQTTVNDEGEQIGFSFEDSTGYGVSFNHFWTEHFSTEAALQKYVGTLNGTSAPLPTIELGELDITSLTVIGEWHFRRGSRFSPYLGAGLAFISGEFDIAENLAEPGEESVDVESELTWTAAAGANVRLTNVLSLTGALEFIPWDAREEDGLLEEAVEVDPLTLSVGLRFSF